MKIHVVQKGETLWKISQKYGVDFEQLKQMNTHLSNPDMIMPGMKIKIPTSTKQVKKEHTFEPKYKKDKKDKKEIKDKKEKKDKQESPSKLDKKKTEKPFKDTSDKAMPVIKEDDSKKPKKEKEDLPMKPVDLPSMPMMDKAFDTDKKMSKLPKVPNYAKQKATGIEKPMKEQPVPTEQAPVQQPQEEQQAPIQQPQIPEQQPMMHQPVYPMMPTQLPLMPMNYYPTSPCCGGSFHHHPHPIHQVPYALTHHTHTNCPEQVMGGNVQYDVDASYSNLPFNPDDLMESSSSSMDMPQMPHHLAGVDNEANHAPYVPEQQNYFQAPPAFQGMQSGMPVQQQPPFPTQNYGYSPMQYPSQQVNPGYLQTGPNMFYPQGYALPQQQGAPMYQSPTGYQAPIPGQRQEDDQQSE